MCLCTCVPDSISVTSESDWLVEWERRESRNGGSWCTDSRGHTVMNNPYIRGGCVRVRVCTCDCVCVCVHDFFKYVYCNKHPVWLPRRRKR